MTGYPRGGDVSQELTEIRTVCSRAESAILKIERMHAHPYKLDAAWGGNGGYDPEANEMLADLRDVVDILAKYRKAGPTKRRV